jgi:hypothetical protein
MVKIRLKKNMAGNDKYTFDQISTLHKLIQPEKKFLVNPPKQT